MTSNTIQCANCRYDLVGLASDAVCPECGGSERICDPAKLPTPVRVALSLGLLTNLALFLLGGVVMRGLFPGGMAEWAPLGAGEITVVIVSVVLPPMGLIAAAAGLCLDGGGWQRRRSLLLTCIVVAWLPMLVALLIISFSPLVDHAPAGGTPPASTVNP